MTGQRGRRWRFSRWAGLCVCVLLVVIWGLSYFVTLHSNWLKRDSTFLGGIGRGYVECYYPARVLLGNSGTLFRGRFGPLQWWPRVRRSTHNNRGTLINGTFVFTTRYCWYVGVPMWLPLLVVAVPTVILWRRSRPTPPCHCSTCGYNLTGNASGVCPECGTEV